MRRRPPTPARRPASRGRPGPLQRHAESGEAGRDIVWPSGGSAPPTYGHLSTPAPPEPCANFPYLVKGGPTGRASNANGRHLSQAPAARVKSYGAPPRTPALSLEERENICSMAVGWWEARPLASPAGRAPKGYLGTSRSCKGRWQGLTRESRRPLHDRENPR